MLCKENRSFEAVRQLARSILPSHITLNPAWAECVDTNTTPGESRVSCDNSNPRMEESLRKTILAVLPSSSFKRVVCHSFVIRLLKSNELFQRKSFRHELGTVLLAWDARKAPSTASDYDDTSTIIDVWEHRLGEIDRPMEVDAEGVNSGFGGVYFRGLISESCVVHKNVNLAMVRCEPRSESSNAVRVSNIKLSKNKASCIVAGGVDFVYSLLTSC
jgi:hypothetical protein